MNKQSLLLIDGFNLLSRGYFATAYGKSEDQLSRAANGKYNNALRIFFQKLFTLIQTHNITHTAIAWDVKREESKRRQQFDFYKATRNELPSPLIQQYETLKEMLDILNIQQLEIAPHEADDIIGALSTQWSQNDYGHCYIYSNDRDLLQLLNSRTSQIIAKKQQEIIYTSQHFFDEYGITPTQWIDVKALLGDSSDNIPGCPGVGEKSALPLVQMYGSVENLYASLEELDSRFNRYRKKLATGQEYTFISKELSTITTDIEELMNYEFMQTKLQIEQDLTKGLLNEFNIQVRGL